MLLAIATVAGYAVLRGSQPACGPPGNSRAGRVNDYIPWVLLLVLLLATTVLGHLSHRTRGQIITGAIATAALAALGGGLVAACFFLAGHCYA
jgi:hypothetical protein